MPKKLMLFIGVLCWISPWLARGIGGVTFNFPLLYLIGTVCLVGAGITHQLEKRSRGE